MKKIFILFPVVIMQLLTINQIAYPQVTESCIDKADVFEQIKCLTDQAVELNDVAVCDRSKHVGVKYQCYAIYAEKLEIGKYAIVSLQIIRNYWTSSPYA